MLKIKSLGYLWIWSRSRLARLSETVEGPYPGMCYQERWSVPVRDCVIWTVVTRVWNGRRDLCVRGQPHNKTVPQYLRLPDTSEDRLSREPKPNSEGRQLWTHCFLSTQTIFNISFDNQNHFAATKLATRKRFFVNGAQNIARSYRCVYRMHYQRQIYNAFQDFRTSIHFAVWVQPSIQIKH